MKIVKCVATSGNPSIRPGSIITYVGVEHRLDLSVLGQLAQVPVPVQERLGTVQDLHGGPNNKTSVDFLFSICRFGLFSSFTEQKSRRKKKQQAAFKREGVRLETPEINKSSH